jgi:hypothetical protein
MVKHLRATDAVIHQYGRSLRRELNLQRHLCSGKRRRALCIGQDGKTFSLCKRTDQTGCRPPDSLSEILDPLKGLNFFRPCPQLTRQVEIHTASVEVSCYASSALVFERLSPKRFCPFVHDVKTTSRAIRFRGSVAAPIGGRASLRRPPHQLRQLRNIRRDPPRLIAFAQAHLLPAAQPAPARVAGQWRLAFRRPPACSFRLFFGTKPSFAWRGHIDTRVVNPARHVIDAFAFAIDVALDDAIVTLGRERF